MDLSGFYKIYPSDQQGFGKTDIAVENIVRKGEIACNKQFLLFSQGLYGTYFSF